MKHGHDSTGPAKEIWGGLIDKRCVCQCVWWMRKLRSRESKGVAQVMVRLEPRLPSAAGNFFSVGHSRLNVIPNEHSASPMP